MRRLRDAIDLFREWRQHAARTGGLTHADAMCVSTVDSTGAPHARFVALKAVRDDGFVFCTSYRSPKSVHIEANPAVALTFWWDHVERQVRVIGTARRIVEADADAFFAQRDRDAQIAAWAFEQSAPLGDERLMDRLDAVRRRFASHDIPRPPHWGGYIVAPSRVEFLAFDPGRAHRRVLYESRGAEWTRSELQP